MYQVRWDVIWDNFPSLLSGLAVGLAIAIGAVFIGAVIGLLAAFARVSPNRVLSRIAGGYVDFVRNIPLLLIIYLIYFGLPTMGLSMLDHIWSLVVAMAIYSGAYLTEIFRAGIQAVSKGLLEAGKSIGLTDAQVIQSITLPLMFRVVLPSLSNTLIGLFKDTSLGASISVPELTYAGMVINTNFWRIIESWTAVGALYLATCYGMAYLLRRLERRYSGWA
jgi:His/Glu/Gln/Arg/opine family amino acid ABC transporter permease subunit